MMSDLHSLGYGQDVDKNMTAITQNFNREVIEITIENLRRKFSERGLSEDLLERLKANWYKNLHLRMQQNKEDALKRQFDIIENQAQINKEHVEVLQQNAIREYNQRRFNR
jgi:hypothetical protein